MRAPRFNSLPQLALATAGFLVTICLLDSEALVTWAGRLEIGPVRGYALTTTGALHRTLQPLGVEQLRRVALLELDRDGWTDDPARLAAARDRPAPVAASPCRTRPPAPGPELTRPPDAALAADVPRLTPLAPLPAAEAGRPRVIALVGDSMMAVSLSDVLLRLTAGDRNIRVVRAMKSGTGLARPDVFDWMEEYPALVGDQRPDAILVAIGANDGQGLTEDGRPLAFGTQAWITVYQQRTAEFLNLLTQNGAHVLWIGLPPMRSGAYNQRSALINRIAYSVAGRSRDATWWNPQSLIGDETGGFREFLTRADGHTVRIRTLDGIHLSDEGAALLAPSLVRWLNPAAPPDQAGQPPHGPGRDPAGPRPDDGRKTRTGGRPERRAAG